jgi:hypothetical protein
MSIVCQARIRTGNHHQSFGSPRVHLRRIDSTNALARDLAARGAPHGTLVTATYDVVAVPPANRFIVPQLKGHPSGSIDVSLASLVGPGTVKVTEHPAGLPAFSVSETAGAKATFKFTAGPSDQLKSWLKRHHRKLAVKVSITYTPRGGKPRSVTKTVRL